MGYLLLSDNIPLGRVELRPLPLPDVISGVRIPRVFAGDLHPFAAYEHVRDVVRAQSVMPKDIGAPWNTAAEEAELERELMEAVARMPDMPPLELRDDANIRVETSSISLHEFDLDSTPMIRVSVRFDEDDSDSVSAPRR
ncbi:MAG: hypothetical protein ABI446_03795 [Gemmatimonadaceae bacterium]